MKVIVIYPGRFHPFHKGHKSVYDTLIKRFGKQNVFISTSNKIDPPKSPFSFEEKRAMMALTGIDPSRVVQVKNPYQATEITDSYDENNTILLFAVSDKDMEEDPRFSFKPKKDGGPSYFQPAGKDMKPFREHGYIVTVPTLQFSVLGKPMRSASEFRSNFAKADVNVQKQMIQDLFGRYDDNIHAVMKNRIIEQLQRADEILEKLIDLGADDKIIVEACERFEMLKEEFITEDLYDEWDHPGPVEYSRFLEKTFGEPDEFTKEQTVWHGVDGFKRIVVRDEYILHGSPRPHYDFVYSYIDLEVDEELSDDLAKCSGSILIDHLKNEVGARCGSLTANAVTLNFCLDVVAGRTMPTKEEYERRIVEMKEMFADGKKWTVDWWPDEAGDADPENPFYAEDITEDLRDWFKQKWVNIGKKRKDGSYAPCGSSGKKSGYAKCVPLSKARSMSKKEKESAVRRKRAAQNKKGRGGKKSGSGKGKKPIRVSTKKESVLEKIQERISQLKTKLEDIQFKTDKKLPNLKVPVKGKKGVSRYMKAKAYTMGKVRPKMQESKKKVKNGVKSTKAV